nr:protein LIKE COV 3-like [Ipomoea batatas]
MATRSEKERELECLIPVVGSDLDSPPSSKFSDSPAASSSHSAGREAFSKVIRSWAWKKFMTGCCLSKSKENFRITYRFNHVELMDTECTSLLGIGEWMIKKMPLVSYVYSASKQISGAISPDQNTNAFKEVAIIKHPRVGEYALGFITSTLMLQKSSGAEELCCVYVPTNHLYLGDIFLVNSNNIMRPNLSVREAIEIVISGGLSIPKVLTIVDLQYMLSTRVGKFSIPEV